MCSNLEGIEKVKIILFHQDLFFQGGEYVVAKLANGLARRGHEVHVVVSKVHDDIAAAHPEAKPFALDAEVDFHVLPFRRAVFNVLPLAVLLRKLKADVVLPNTGHYLQCAALAQAVGCDASPLVYVEHNSVAHSANRLTRWCLRRCTRVVAVSEGVRAGLLDVGVPSQKLVRIYNPILDDKIEEGEIHPWLGDKRGFVFVAAGALTSGKGFMNLIAAFARVHAEYPTARLLIFGRGPQFDELQRQISSLHLNDVVQLAGFSTCLRKNLSAADGFVMSSQQETFSIVLVEALAAGLPIVSTDCPVGPREVLDNGRLGALVPVDDVEAMARAMVEVAQGRRFDRPDITPYKTETALDAYEKLLNEVVSE